MCRDKRLTITDRFVRGIVSIYPSHQLNFPTLNESISVFCRLDIGGKRYNYFHGVGEACI